MIQLAAYGLPPLATASVYLLNFTPDERKKVGLRQWLVCMGCFWIAAALLTWYGAWWGLYSMDSVLLNTVLPLGAIGLGLSSLSGAFSPSFMFPNMTAADRVFLVGVAAAMIPGLLAAVDAMTGQHFYAFRIFVWTAALPWIRAGYVYDAKTFYMGATLSVSIFVLPMMLGGLGYMFRGLSGIIGRVAERWCAFWGSIMLFQVIFYFLLAVYTLLTQ
jgi:hypothetical protein